MFFSKLWFGLVAIALGVAAAVLIVGPRTAQSDVDAQLEGRLVAADGAVQSLLKVYARRWIDAVGQVASDAELDEALAEAQRSSANRDLLHETVQGRLRSFNAEWKASFLVAVDGNGVVMARAGEGEQRWGDDISGRPVVEEALRGWRLDDTWDQGGKLYRVCATPIIARDKYVGALLVGHELGGELAARMREMLGLDVAFIAAGQVVARSGPPLVVEKELARVVAEHRAAESAARPERPRVEPIAVEQRKFGTVLSALAGEAGEHASYVALVAERPQIVGTLGLLAALDGAERSWRELAMAGGALLFVLLVGYASMSAEHSGRVRRLKVDVQELGRGGRERLDVDRHKGEFGAIGRSINAAIDRAVRDRPRGERPLVRSQDDLEPSPRKPQRGLTPPIVAAAKKAGGGQKGALTPAVVPAVHLPGPSFEDPGEVTALGGPSALPGVALPPKPAPVSPVLAAIEGGGPPPLLASLDETTSHHAQRQGTPLARTGGSGMMQIGPPAMAQIGPPAMSAPVAASAFASGGYEETPLPPAQPAATFAAPYAATAYAGPTDEAPPTVPGHPHGGAPLNPVEDVAVAPSLGEFHEVFEEFVATKLSCGEPTETLTYERFAEKLRKNRDQLLERHGCKSVRFQVYVKDGKAALRATPI